jgi:3-hydroxyisobutyrate dehydrogenase-like beta-hydroxyacid dehydrogenase
MGEAGSAIAADLVSAGVEVRGFDPLATAQLDGVESADSAAAAARDCDAVLSLNSAAAAVGAAESVAPQLPETLFADLNTAAPARKREVDAVVRSAGGSCADVGLLGPVPGHGLRTPALASGPGAARFEDLLGGLGMPVTVVGDEAGEASARKLARSVFAKGLAAAIGESMAAAEKLGCEDWMHAELERTLSEADGALLRRLIEGSRLHAARRVEEMRAAAEMLEELEVQPRVATAAGDWLRSLAEQGEGR